MQTYYPFDQRFKNDTVLQAINSKFLTLKDYEMKISQEHLQEFMDVLIDKMKQTDSFFRKTFQRIVFSGSYYKNTKICKPEEFDLNIIINLPVNYNTVMFESQIPGNTKICLWKCFNSKTTLETDRTLLNFLNTDMYLDRGKFKRWAEGVIDKTVLQISSYRELVINGNKYKMKVSKSGPAFTISLTIPNGQVISIDVVFALEFHTPLPAHAHKLRNMAKKTWVAVPKPMPYTTVSKKEIDLYWRISFCEQEKMLLARIGFLKPVIRQMKKLRDTQGWYSIASYYIETLALYQAKNADCVKMSQTMLFMQALKDLCAACERQELPFYWDENLNLLQHISTIEVYKIGQTLKRMINDIERSISNDQFVIAKYILNRDELSCLKDKTFENNEINTADAANDSWCSII